MRRAIEVLFLAFLLGWAVGCGDPESGDERLIPPGDGDYTALEAPEAPGECADSTGCEISCTHACAPVPTGPTTCPSPAPEKPERVVGASCLCVDSVCAYY